MKTKYNLSIIFSIAIVSMLQAQSASDALRYSILEAGGTARFVGAGSSASALGADFSVLSTNPAGLGWYRRSEFVITPGLVIGSSTARLRNDASGRGTEDSRGEFIIPGFGVVVANTPTGGDWQNVNFGIGLNRVADFNQQLFFQGDSRGSIVDRFLELGNDFTTLTPFESKLAFDAGAIYDIDEPADGFYESDFELEPDALISKQQTVINKGSINELAFSFAGNYKERLLIGATIGLPFVTFTEEKTYQEFDNGAGADGDVPFFDDLTFTQRLTTTGLGVNVKAGIIVRPHQTVRLGAAIHSPTFYSLEDSYSNSLTYNYTNADGPFTDDADSPDGLSEYKLRTPWRYLGSAGVIIGKAGFLTGEVDYADYAKNRFRYENDFKSAEQELNDSISFQMTDALNIRLGGELVYDIFRFRGGFGLHYSPYLNDDTVNNSFSAGLGIRGQSFFLDVAFRRFQYKETYVPYLTSRAPQQFVDNDVNRDQLLLTLGFKF